MKVNFIDKTQFRGMYIISGSPEKIKSIENKIEQKKQAIDSIQQELEVRGAGTVSIHLCFVTGHRDVCSFQ